MMNKTRYIIIACLAVVVAGSLLVSSQLQPVKVKADIYSIAGVSNGFSLIQRSMNEARPILVDRPGLLIRNELDS